MVNQILNKIKRIKESFPDPDSYLVASALATEFKGYVMFNTKECIFTDGNGTFFDKNGLMEIDEALVGNYTRLAEHPWFVEVALIKNKLDNGSINNRS